LYSQRLISLLVVFEFARNNYIQRLG
jgi:hypothetical protein